MSRVHTNTGPMRTAGPDRCGFCEQEWPCHGYRLEEADARALAGRAVQDDWLLRDACQYIVYQDDPDRLPDNACAECVPEGRILVEGFRCIQHRARAYLGLGSFTPLRATPPLHDPKEDQ